MRHARDTGDFTAFTIQDAAFHLALVHSAGNKIISLFYDNLYNLITDVIALSSRVPTKSLGSRLCRARGHLHHDP